MPGLSATLGIALLTTLTIKMAPNDAILVLICVYVGAIYGGSRTAILLNIPGTAANAAACLDGYVLARQGQAGRAMGIATTGSVVGSLFGVVCLAMFTPLLAEVALTFGAFEFFWLGMFGVMMSGSLTGEDAVEGLDDGVARPVRRAPSAWTRSTPSTASPSARTRSRRRHRADPGAGRRVRLRRDPDGDDRRRRTKPLVNSVDSVLPRFGDVFRYWRTVLRSGVIGVYRRHPAGRGRGHGRLVVVCGGQAREPRARAVRQGLDRGPDRRRDRRQRLDSRRASSRRSRWRSRGRRRRRC